MRGEVPNDIYVMLEQSQVDAGRIVVVEIPEHTVVDELAHSLHCPGEQESVIHHDLQVLALCKFNQFFSLSARAGERFLDENMLTVFQSCFCKVIVSANRSDNCNCIDVSRLQYFVSIPSHIHIWIGLQHASERVRALVANHHDTGM